MFKGYGNSLKNLAEGVTQTITNPAATIEGLKHLAKDPVGSAKAMADQIREKLNSGHEGIGEVIGDVLVGVAVGGFAKAAGEIVKAGRAGNLACQANKSLIGKGPGCFVAGTMVLTSSGPRAIETIQVGERVLTAEDSPLPQTEVEPESWRRIHLDLKPSGTDGKPMAVEMLRSEGWLAAVRAEVGSRIWLKLEELKLNGWATVKAIGPCPPISGGNGRVVTATFTHTHGDIRTLTLGSASEPDGLVPTSKLEATYGHPIYSLTRQDWVKAGTLQLGERLQTLCGEVVVLSNTSLTGTHPVFNLEVEGIHEYLAGEQQVRVHNSMLCSKGEPRAKPPGKGAAKKPITPDRPEHGTTKHDAAAYNQAKAWENDPNTVEARFNQALVDGDGNQISGMRPDAQRVRADGKIDVLEVRSPSQSDAFMNAKKQKYKDLLGDKAGDIEWIGPHDSPFPLTRQ